MHFAVMTGNQRWVYLPNSNMAATVRLPSGRIKRKLRISLLRSCPLAIALAISSSDASCKTSPIIPFFSNTIAKRFCRNYLIVTSSKSSNVASLTAASSGVKLPHSVIISANSALSKTLRLSAPFFIHTIPLLSW